MAYNCEAPVTNVSMTQGKAVAPLPLALAGNIERPPAWDMGRQLWPVWSIAEAIAVVSLGRDSRASVRALSSLNELLQRGYVIVAGFPPRDEQNLVEESKEFRVDGAEVFKAREDSRVILKKAAEKMGLLDDIASGNSPVFSQDILKVEVRGPKENYLTIIDVPRIFRTTTQGTTKDDKVLVRDLMKSFIKDDRTIILAVLPANVDIAMQEILELAEEHDKKGERTVGVLTKPDLVIEASAQAAVCDLVLGKKRPLTLGYYLVRNRGADAGLCEQSELDKMFRQQPWCDIPDDRKGIPALKERLELLLINISRREFPKLLRDVSDMIKESKKELDNLGPPRQDEREQRRFLSQIAGSFQELVRAALAADYNSHLVFRQDQLRLITQVSNITDVFSADFQNSAHSRQFDSISLTNSLTQADECLSPSVTGEERPVDPMMDGLQALLKKARLDEITPEESVELGDIVVLLENVPLPHEDVSHWICDNYLHSRGMDLGTFNPSFVSEAFAEQSRKWGSMTKIYMSRIIIAIHRFTRAALSSIGLEERARIQLWSAILESVTERYKIAMDEAVLLIEVERHKQPSTLNRQFYQAVSKARGARMTEFLRPKARKDSKQYGEIQYMVSLNDIVGAAECKSNVDHLREEIHDILRSYYSLALDRFIDNVFQLAVNHHLLRGPSSPLKVLTPDWVMTLEADQLEKIVGETKFAKRSRTRLAKKIDDLSTAFKILKTY